MIILRKLLLFRFSVHRLIMSCKQLKSFLRKNAQGIIEILVLVARLMLMLVIAKCS